MNMWRAGIVSEKEFVSYFNKELPIEKHEFETIAEEFFHVAESVFEQQHAAARIQAAFEGWESRRRR